MATRHFARDTQTEANTGGSNPGGVWDLLTTQGTSATMGSGNTASSTFITSAVFVKTVGTSVNDSSFPISIDMASVSASTMEWQARVQRRNSAGVVQAESGNLGPFNTAGIKTGTLTLSTTWAAGDQAAIILEHRKTGGGGNRSFTLNVNDADTYVDITLAGTVESGDLSSSGAGVASNVGKSTHTASHAIPGVATDSLVGKSTHIASYAVSATASDSLVSKAIAASTASILAGAADALIGKSIYEADLAVAGVASSALVGDSIGGASDLVAAGLATGSLVGKATATVGLTSIGSTATSFPATSIVTTSFESNGPPPVVPKLYEVAILSA